MSSGILERLSKGPVVGDGSMVFTLEKRGYASAGPWTPEAVVEYPDAVLQLHKEYVRAGADVVQTATFFASDFKLNHSNDGTRRRYTTKEINSAACQLARKAAEDNNCLVSGGISPTTSFEPGVDEQLVAAEFAKQCDVYREHRMDFVMCEFFSDIEEVEICAREMKKLNIPVSLCMRLGPKGDDRGVSVEECAVRMAKTGAEIIGTNCVYDINTALKVMERIKSALDKEDLHPYLSCQPLGMLCPEVEESPVGYLSLPEFPFAMDSRSITRIEAHQYARKAYELGVNYIGGCCGFESHHIRSIAQELQPERGIIPPVSDKAEAFGGKFLKLSSINECTGGKRSTREYWYSINKGSGRPYDSALSTPAMSAGYIVNK